MQMEQRQSIYTSNLNKIHLACRKRLLERTIFYKSKRVYRSNADGYALAAYEFGCSSEGGASVGAKAKLASLPTGPS